MIDAAGNEGGEAGGQPAGGERGEENGGQGAQASVADTQRAIRRSASAPPTLWRFAARPAWTRRSISAAAGASMDTVRAAAVDFLIQHNGPVGARMSDNSREQDNFRQAAVDGLLFA